MRWQSLRRRKRSHGEQLFRYDHFSARMTGLSRAEAVLDHLEKHLGGTFERLRLKGKSDLGFEVLSFEHAPNFGDRSLVTYGLSAHRLSCLETLGRNDRCVELMLCANGSYRAEELAALLIAVGTHVLDNHEIPCEHDILDGSGPVRSGGNSRFEHLYLTAPGYFEPDFQRCSLIDPPAEIVHLVPITSEERSIIRECGWQMFEDAVITQSIDLLDFDNRQAVCIHSIV